MVTLQRFFTPLLCSACVLIALSCWAAEDVRFSWALMVDGENGLQALDFQTPPLVKEGTTLQLYLHPESNTYVYIFLLDSSNSFTPIFPGSPHYYDANPPGTPIYIPAGEDRFTTLPPAGQEKFYLLASAERLLTVENLLEKCLDVPDDVNSRAQLFQEVRSVRRVHSKISQFTEKGMPVSGTVRGLTATRGVPQKPVFTATSVVADGFYSRILRLNHE